MISRPTVPVSTDTTATYLERSPRPSRLRRRAFAAAIGSIAMLAGSTAAVAADQDPSVAVQDATVGFSIVRASEGALVELGVIEVDADLIGRACTLTASVYNQKSVNPGNDVIVATGGTKMTLANIEAQADATTTGSISVVAGDVVTFTLVMGPRKVYSGQLHMSLECHAPAMTTTTTTTAPPTTTADIVTTTTAGIVTTTTATTTTTEPIQTAVLPAHAAAPVPGQPSFTG